jgi:hypothetical protein
MKKYFAVGRIDSPQIKNLNKGILIAQRANNTIILSNIEIQKTGIMPVIQWHPSTSELVFKFQMREGEFLALGEKQGLAKKEQLDERNTGLQGIKLHTNSEG